MQATNFLLEKKFPLLTLLFLEHKPQAAKFHAFRVSKFKHLSGKPSKKSFNIENIKNFDQSLSHESDGLQAYNDLVAYPIAGPGGQIAVVKVNNITYHFRFNKQIFNIYMLKIVVIVILLETRANS